MKLGLKLLVLVSIVLFSNVSQAGLIINGGFEDTHVADGNWRWFSSSNVDGWEGSNIEIWDSLTKFESYEGEQHAELNAHGSTGAFSIFQTFSTDVNASYDVSFAYAARRSNSEAFLFEVLDDAGSSLFSKEINDHTVKSWSTFDWTFSATSVLTTIRFTTINTGTYGNFLDDVDVVASSNLFPSAPTAVSEPSGIFLVSMMISALLLFRLKMS